MVFPVYASSNEVGGPAGHSYAVVLVRGGEGVLPALRSIRFSGWVARAPVDGWLPVVTASGEGTVAGGRRGVIGVGEALAGLGAPVLAIRVLKDRQLALVAWAEGEEAGRYVSDPSLEPDAEEDVLAITVGDENAHVIAALCERPDAGDDLAEVLGEELDPESTIESERLGRTARLLGLPTWLVAIPSLPRDIPTGPSRRDWIRLGAGVPGLAGYVTGWAVNLIRKRRPPPPALTDPPRGSSGMDPWLM
ncbi:hypothetical protein AB0M20_16315 [Actinoplanes sp. NPDC051633]|uniref:hypothetical protein n=1 Tax=Actinoplanes sp. NPDC051633 TaxID=3155670 RepID=UPI00343092DB